MIKVRNKEVVTEIARTTYQANKKRNVLTIFAIILTTVLIAVVIALGISYWNTICTRQIRMFGMDYDISLTDPRQDQIETMRSMENVKYAGLMVKCAIIEGYQDKMLDKVQAFYLDETCFTKQVIPALEEYWGTYPKKKNEIMLSISGLKTMGIENPKIGQELSLTYYILKDQDEEIKLKENFILSGYYKNYSNKNHAYISKEFFNSTGVKPTDFTQGSLTITLKNPLYSEKDIIAMQKELALDRNQIIEADHDTISSFCKMILVLLVLLLLIFISGYLFIYNTLYIFISKDIRYYGQLKTIGMTSVQLKNIIYYQTILNSMIGIPIGLFLSWIIAKAAIPKFLNIINPTLEIESIVSVNIGEFFIAGLFAFLVNMISSQKPAKMAGNCSPIEALRYIQNIHRKNRKRENGSIVSMALQNMFRDKKQAVVIFSSFIIAISLFLIVNVIIRGNDSKRILNELWTSDIQFLNQTTLEEEEQLITEEKIKQIREISGVESVRKVTSAEILFPYQEDIFDLYYKTLYESRYSPGNYEEDIKAYKENDKKVMRWFGARLIGIDEKGLELLNEKTGNLINPKKFEDGKIAIASNFWAREKGDCKMTGKTVTFFLDGESEQKTEHSISIAFVGDSTVYDPSFFAGGYSPNLIVSENYAKKLLGETYTELIEVTYVNAFSKETEKKVKAVFKKEKKVSNSSKLDQYSEMKNMETQVKVLGGSLGFLMALLAVLNYMNMMSASVQNRSREFAILESIGMTTNQIKKILMLEGAGYAGISSVVSLGIGLPMSYIVFNGMKLYQNLYSIPWIYNLILFLVILILCMTLPVMIYQITQKISLIDRIRESENL